MVCNTSTFWFLLVATNLVKAQTDDLQVQYLVGTIIQGTTDSATYDPPQDAYQYMAANQTPAEYGTFDYVIVGAGSAGAVLATRLSEDQDVSVLLIEAGDPATTFIEIPGMTLYALKTKFSWAYPSIPQTNCCLGMIGHRCYHSRGRGLGGSSLVNAMIYSRGHINDYDSWAATGNEGWSFKEVLPFFKKSENSQIQGDRGFHGKGGLLNVDYPRPVTVMNTQFLEANQEVGRNLVDYNGKRELGVSMFQFTTQKGIRQHTGKVFLEKSDNRPNLQIVTDSYAKKVEIDKFKYARSVLFDHNGQTYRTNAKRMIVLSAGAYASPQLLMLSGIGPADHLKSVNIPVVKDLPVGENYQDHPTQWGLFFTTNYTDPVKSVFEYVAEYINGYGYFTLTGFEAVSFLRTKTSRTPIDVPNIELLLTGTNRINPTEQFDFNYDNETFNMYWGSLNPQNSFRIVVALLKPQSRGTVRLNSSNPYEYPRIDSNLLSDERGEDIQAMYEGIMEAIELTKTDAYKKIDVKLVYKVLPDCQKYEYYSKEQWYCQIRHLTSHAFHPIGTCKMGPLTKGGVVDNRLRVHGIRNLGVADSSVIPESIAGHTNAPAIMIGEKMADMIRFG